jgi:hypothetical protein
MPLEEWRNEQNHRYSMVENDLYIVNRSHYRFFKLIFFIGIIGFLILGALFIYYLEDGALKTEFNQNIPINPSFNNTVNNNYTNNYNNNYEIDANIPNNFYNNFTINLEVKQNCS